jgi:hypothetical protein
MQVRPCDSAGGSGETDNLTALHNVTDFDENLG